MEHCAISQCVVSKLSFRRRVTQFIATSTSDFSASQQWVLLAMDGPSKCPLHQQHAAFLQQQGFIPKFNPQGCKPTMHYFAPAGRILAHAQKSFLQWRMGSDFNPHSSKNQEGPENSRSDDPLQHSQVAIGNLRLRWLLGSLPLAMNHAILGTDLPHNIDESTYFCL